MKLSKVMVSKLTAVIVLLFLVVLSLLDGSSLNFSSTWIPFMGRFHPVVLHLPIGLFVGVVVLELYAMFRPTTRAPEKIHFLLLFTFYSTAISALFGIFLSWEGGYDSDALNFHKWGGVVTAAAVLALDGLIGRRRVHQERLPVTYLAGLVITAGVISITGHQGGSLTHGSNYLTEYNPFASREEFVETGEDVPVFVSHIQPVLKDYCYQCHSAEKIKSELRLDSFELIMAGGLSGPVLVPGDSEASNLMHVLHLPLEEDEHMPPKGKPQPNTETINLLAWWIDEGASQTATQEELNITAEVAPQFLEIDVLEIQPRDAVEAHLESVEKSEALAVQFVAQEDSRLSVIGKKATDADLLELIPLKSNVVELNLANSAVTDVALETIGQMTNLTHLYLNNTAVSDAGLEQLSNLYQLEYLNLYGTDITDRGVLALHRLNNLRKVYLWQTSVTTAAVADLRSAVFNAVESEKIRAQILELSKERKRLEVEIVSSDDSQ